MEYGIRTVAWPLGLLTVLALCMFIMPVEVGRVLVLLGALHPEIVMVLFTFWIISRLNLRCRGQVSFNDDNGPDLEMGARMIVGEHPPARRPFDFSPLHVHPDHLDLSDDSDLWSDNEVDDPPPPPGPPPQAPPPPGNDYPGALVNPKAKKRGRPRAVDTPAAIARSITTDKKNKKLNRLLSIEACSDPRYDDGLYSPSLILKLRMYFWALSTVDQRSFLSPGVRCTLDLERLNKGGDLGSVPLHINYRLERPELLEARLANTLTDRLHLPVPALSECHGRSQKWLHWAVGRSVCFIHQPE